MSVRPPMSRSSGCPELAEGLDGTVVRARLDRIATSISLLAALGVRQDGQKILLAVKNMGGVLRQAQERSRLADASR